MKQNSWLWGVFVSLVANYSFADTYPGYLNSAYGAIVRGAYGQCVRTAYYSANDGLAQCGDAESAPKKPIPLAPKIVLETVMMSDADNILFNFNIATLTDSGNLKLSEFIDKIDHESDVTKITIDGYTDAIGKYDYNMKLSQDRANAVKQFFLTKGFAEDKITATGYGPKGSKASDACFARYGQDPLDMIWNIQHKLESKQFRAQQFTQSLRHEKQQLQAKLAKLEQQHQELIACAAPDRRVIFTIEHTEQVETTKALHSRAASIPVVK